jgi:hypothetical protein
MRQKIRIGILASIMLFGIGTAWAGDASPPLIAMTMPRYHVTMRNGRFRADPPPDPTFLNQQQILNKILDLTHGALIVEATASGAPGSPTTFYATDQIFNKVFDATNTALVVNCISGCSGGGGTPAAPSGSLQYNNGGAFGGWGDFLVSSHTGSLGASGVLDLSAATITNVKFNGTGFTSGHLLAATVVGGVFTLADGGAPGAITGGTANSVLFLGAGGVPAQDNPNFYYDPIAHILNLSGGEKYTGPYTQQITFTTGSSGLQTCPGYTVCVTASSAIQPAGYSIPGFSNAAPSSANGSFLVWGAAVGTPPVVPDPTLLAFDGNAAHCLSGAATFISCLAGIVPLANGGTAQDFSATGGTVNTSGTQLVHQNASHTMSVSALVTQDIPTAQVTRTVSFSDLAPASGDDGLILLLNPATAIHITRVSCGVTGTSTVINLVKATLSLVADMTCLTGDANTVTTATFVNTGSQCGGTTSCAVAAHAPVTLHVGTVTAATGLFGSIDYTVD